MMYEILKKLLTALLALLLCFNGYFINTVIADDDETQEIYFHDHGVSSSDIFIRNGETHTIEVESKDTRFIKAATDNATLTLTNLTSSYTFKKTDIKKISDTKIVFDVSDKKTALMNDTYSLLLEVNGYNQKISTESFVLTSGYHKITDEAKMRLDGSGNLLIESNDDNYITALKNDGYLIIEKTENGYFKDNKTNELKLENPFIVTENYGNNTLVVRKNVLKENGLAYGTFNLRLEENNYLDVTATATFPYIYGDDNGAMGEKVTLKSVAGANWLSEDPNIATVEGGVVNCVNEGTTKIQVSYDGSIDTIEFTVFRDVADLEVKVLSNGNLEFKGSNDALKAISSIKIDELSIKIDDLKENEGSLVLEAIDQRNKYSLENGEYHVSVSFTRYIKVEADVTLTEAIKPFPNNLNVSVNADGSITINNVTEEFFNTIQAIFVTERLNVSNDKLVLKDNSINIIEGLCFVKDGEKYTVKFIYKSNNYDNNILDFTFTGTPIEHTDGNRKILKEATCLKEGRAEYECKLCKEKYEVEIDKTTHKLLEIAATSAVHTTTSLKPGTVAAYYCSYCKQYFNDKDATSKLDTIINNNNIPAHNIIVHSANAATCLEDGNKEYYECTVCGGLYADANALNITTVEAMTIEKTGHKLTHTKAKAETCTEKGNIEYYFCNNCQKYFADVNATKEIELKDTVVNAKGHGEFTSTVTVEPNCTEKGVRTYKCPDCDYSYTESINALGHKITHTAKVDPTCTIDGLKEYYHCETCNKYFTDNTYKVPVNKDDLTIPATGHDMVKTARVEATCTKEGNVEYYTCKTCKKVFADILGKSELTNTVIGKTNHIAGTPAKENVIEATYFDAGSYDSVTKCKECGTELERKNITLDPLKAEGLKDAGLYVTADIENFNSGKGSVFFTNEITVKSEVTYAAVYFDGIKLTKAVSTDNYISGNTDYLNVSNNGNGKITLVPTLSGNHIVKLSLNRNGIFYPITVNVTTKCSHNYVSAVTAEPDCENEGEKTYTCTKCNNSYKEAISKLGHSAKEAIRTNEVAATCTEDGSYVLETYCERCDLLIASNTYKVSKLGHSENLRPVSQITKQPSCTEEGSKETKYYCERCNAVVREEKTTLNKTEHVKGNPTAQNDVDPTCTKSGIYDLNTRCIYCDELLDSETVIVKALGHLATEPQRVNVVDPTCTEDGSYELETRCEREGCNEVLEKNSYVIPALGHTFGNPEITRVDPDCGTDTNGSLTVIQKCTTCNEEKTTVTLLPVAHLWSTEKLKDNKETMEYYECALCGGVKDIVYLKTEELNKELIQKADPEVDHNDISNVSLDNNSNLQSAIALNSNIMDAVNEENTNTTIKANLVVTAVPEENLSDKLKEAAASEGAVAMDLSMNMVIEKEKDGYTETTVKNVESLSEPIKAVIQLTSKVSEDPNDEITYTVLHDHNGVTETLYPEYNSYANTLTIETSGFSSIVMIPVVKHNHKALTEVKENEYVEEFGCKSTTTYDLVSYCSSNHDGNKFEIGRRKVVETSELDHIAKEEAVKTTIAEATCLKEGQMKIEKVCEKCEKVISTAYETINKINHIKGDEIKENEVSATCFAEGSYDSVYKCTTCEKEISRISVPVQKTQHTPLNIPENKIITEATCISKGLGQKITKCSECDEILATEFYDIEMTGHDNVDFEENGIKGVRCDDCKKIVSAELIGENVKTIEVSTLVSEELEDVTAVKVEGLLSKVNSEKVPSKIAELIINGNAEFEITVDEATSVAAKVTEYLDGGTILKSLDISATIEAFDEKIIIHDLKDKQIQLVEIEIELPEKEGRSWYILHEIDSDHIDPLDATYKNGVLSFKTGSFSNFHIVYKDVSNNPGGPSNPSNNPGGYHKPAVKTSAY